MTERAIILIPDISGFTEFTGATEINHAAHIITELLELIIASNETDFTLAEIEGDAVLLYRKGEPLRREQLVDQCLRMFANFHRRLRLIERSKLCQCGACQTASNLTLKFIAHFGYIKEIKVAQFVKATGIDMIVAHRLQSANSRATGTAPLHRGKRRRQSGDRDRCSHQGRLSDAGRLQ